MNTTTKSLLEILAMDSKDYLIALYKIAKTWEASRGLSGTLANKAVKGWFVDMANKQNEKFAENIFFSITHMQHYLWLSNGTMTHRAIFGAENIRPYFIASLQKMGKELNQNGAVMELYLKNIKKRTN